MDFGITDEAVDELTLVIAPRGEVDMRTAPQLDRCLREALESGKRFFVVDLERVSFLDSSALRVLLTAQRNVQDEEGRLAVACADPQIVKIFEITALDGILRMSPTRERALAAVGWQRDS